MTRDIIHSVSHFELCHSNMSGRYTISKNTVVTISMHIIIISYIQMTNR